MRPVLTILFAFLFSTAICQAIRAQQRPNVDTLSLFGIRTAVAGSSSLTGCDTIFWNEGLGIGMLSKKIDLFRHKGDLRIAIKNSAVDQVTFAIGAKNKEDATAIYSDVCSQIQQSYGNPDAIVTTDPPEIRWEGIEQFFAVRMAIEHNAVNVVLSKFEHN